MHFKNFSRWWWWWWWWISFWSGVTTLCTDFLVVLSCICLVLLPFFHHAVHFYVEVRTPCIDSSDNILVVCATVMNASSVDCPTVRLPGFHVPRRQWKLNPFAELTGPLWHMLKEMGSDNEMCDCGDIQTMSHIVTSCPLTKFDGGLQHLYTADEAAIDWLTS